MQATFTCISTAGNAVFLAGDQALQSQIGGNGAVPIEPVKRNMLGSAAVQSALRTLITEPRANLLENEHNLVCARSITVEGMLTAALSDIRRSTVFPGGNWLADQMRIVARLIAARGSLSAKRQVFLVSLGGFDLHENLIAQHGGLLDKVSGAMTAFHAATLAKWFGVSNIEQPDVLPNISNYGDFAVTLTRRRAAAGTEPQP